jgi:hypothetical protein
LLLFAAVIEQRQATELVLARRPALAVLVNTAAMLIDLLLYAVGHNEESSSPSPSGKKVKILVARNTEDAVLLRSGY